MADDRRRCRWCGRLCKYYGEDPWHNCTRCQLWYRRNRYCQIKHDLCRGEDECNTTVLRVLISTDFWPRVLDMVCGNKHDLDMKVQIRIWTRVLRGPRPAACSWTPYSDPCDPAFWYPWVCPPESSKLRKFWMLQMTKGCSALLRENSKMFCGRGRILCVIIAFLGTFSDFGLHDGIRWNRGPVIY